MLDLALFHPLPVAIAVGVLMFLASLADARGRRDEKMVPVPVRVRRKRF
jgi:hypothetical protein